LNGSELELITFWVVILTAGLRALLWVLFFILLRTGAVELTASVKPRSRQNGTANGKTAPKTDSPKPDGTVSGA